MKRKGKAWHLGIQRMLQRAASYKIMIMKQTFLKSGRSMLR
ncbi:hypothetical protein RR47_GL002038 [Enterococcus columbae DSM 7374 = ATCC 51263]|nr:hypothetical protein RR47_GL002038 [Enterococcus columbae DSM 7374 = ATCC 51263]